MPVPQRLQKLFEALCGREGRVRYSPAHTGKTVDGPWAAAHYKTDLLCLKSS